MLGLLIVSPYEDPERGLVFEFRSGLTIGLEVMNVHSKGRITIAIAEVNDTQRERRREVLREPYRTLLGHFLHEVAHNHQNRLVHDTPGLHPTEPALTRSIRERGAMLRGEIAVMANELATVGLPLPVLRPEAGVMIELAAVPAA